MKKIFAILTVTVFMLVAVSCGSPGESGKSDLTLDKFIQTFASEGIEVDSNGSPWFGLIQAVDGVMFKDFERQKVVVYEYESSKALKDAQKNIETIKNWESNGKFLLESNNSKVKDIFASVK